MRADAAAMALLVALAVAGVAAPLGAQASPALDARVHPEVRSSIVIRADADFLTPLSGVRGGSGTPEDPYVISNYTIVQSWSAGISLRHTRAHVVIENVWISGYEGRYVAWPACLMDGPTFPCDDMGIEIRDAENVTVRNVRVLATGNAVEIAHSRRIVMDGLHAGTPSGWPGGIVGGVEATDSRDLRVRNLTAHRSGAPVLLARVSDAIVENSTLEGSHGLLMPVMDATNVTFERNVWHGPTLSLQGKVVGLRVAGNDFTGGSKAVSMAGRDASVHDLLVCGNRFSNYTGLGAVDLMDGTNWTLRGNAFEDNYRAMTLDRVGGARVEANLLRGSTDRGLLASGAPLRIHGNHLGGNVEHVITSGDRYEPDMDATGNWWGAPDGPSGAGAGSGDYLWPVDGETVPLSPWLESPPTLAVQCDGPELPRPTGSTPASFTQSIGPFATSLP